MNDDFSFRAQTAARRRSPWRVIAATVVGAFLLGGVSAWLLLRADDLAVPDLLSINREAEAEALEAVKAEAADPELAVLRWMAARGLHITTLLGTCPLSAEERDRLFDRLIDDARSPALAKTAKPTSTRPSRGRSGAVKKTD